MPTTPVTAARQCLTQEAAAVLDEAVAMASRRGHGQTTSLHMVSSLLSLPNSSLREACTRARSSTVAYSARAQFKALDLSLSVSLDRLPSNSQNRADTEPPVSNSLMAAIKRSQANQRRQPENYALYHQQQKQSHQFPSSSSSSTIPVVRVELQNLIISILDDPLVSRVFGEAGFRNYDIKMAILRKGSDFYSIGCTSMYKRPSPPLFLSNFPFLGGDDDSFSTRVGEIMKREKKKCPLLLGASAVDALKSFLEKVSKGVVMEDGPRVVCVKDEIFRCLNGEFDDGPLRLKLEEVEKMVGNVKVVVGLGDFKEFAGDGVDGFRIWVEKLGKLVEDHRGRLWLIGAAANYEVYFKVLEKFPSIEEDWDLEVLPVTSFNFSVGGSYPRSSLMESFVPLGGFFPIPPETKSPLSNASQTTVRCHLCNEKYEQEVAALSNGELRASVAQQGRSNLPSWMQPAESGLHSGASSIMGKDDSMLLTAKIMGLQRKWDGICRQHHLNPTFSKGYQFPHCPSFQVAVDRKINESINSSKNPNESLKELVNKNTLPSSPLNRLSSPDSVSKAKNLSNLSESNNTDFSLGITTPSVSRKPETPTNHTGAKDPKSIYKALVERVSQQEEAISAITDAITNCQTKTNVWINIRGADRLGKKKLGLALAEILFGTRDSLIYVDLNFRNDTTHAETLFNRQVINKYDLTIRGTVMDYLVEKLSKKPSVVFFENIDEADLVVQNSLLQAVKNGRLTDLRGREVKISNCIFLGTTFSGEKSNKYTEGDILRAKGCSIQMVIRYDLNDDPTSENLTMNKRKFVGESTSMDQCESIEVTKRAREATKSYLDLNLPAEGIETCDGDYESDSSSEKSRLWLEDLDRQVDRTVVFKAFDFDALADKLLMEINSCMQNIVGSKCSIEIEPNVMRQIIAAAYLFGNKRVEDWIQSVVSKAFLEAMGKFGLSARSIVKIVGCESSGSEELLPDRILIK